MKLDFIVAGFAKCGTTTLCSLLNDHPDICISKIKEPNFFVHHYDRGWRWFDTLFEESTAGQLRGEGSTLYSSGKFASQASEKIARDCPDVRLIFMVRDPIARAEAAFRDMHNTGYFLYRIDTPYALHEAMEQLPCLTEDSFYQRNINIYRQHFADDRIHVMFLESFAVNPALELEKCLRFLGADASLAIERPGRRLNGGDTKMHDAKLLRGLRKFKPFRQIWNRLDLETQNRWGQRLRLRKRFEAPIQWESGVLEEFARRIQDDSINLLEFCDRPRSFWNLSTRLVGSGKENLEAA